MTADRSTSGIARRSPSRPAPAPTTDVAETDVLPEAVEPLPLDRPEAPESRLARLRRRLAGSNNALGRGLLMLLSRDQIDEQTWEDFEDTLITADLGVGPTTELVDNLRTRFRVEGVADPSAARRDPPRPSCWPWSTRSMDRTIHADRTDTPAVDDGRRRQRHRQDHHGRQARPGAGGRGQGGPARCRRHLPGRGRRSAGDLGRSGGRAHRPRCRGSRPGQRRVRGGEDRHRGRGRRGADRHRRPAAHQDRADGRAGQGEARHRTAGAGRGGAAGARCDHRVRTV